MIRIIFHNKEAMSTNNINIENGLAEFTDVGGNYVTVPLTSVLMIVKLKEQKKEEVESGASS